MSRREIKCVVLPGDDCHCLERFLSVLSEPVLSDLQNRIMFEFATLEDAYDWHEFTPLEKGKKHGIYRPLEHERLGVHEIRIQVHKVPYRFFGCFRGHDFVICVCIGKPVERRKSARSKSIYPEICATVREFGEI